ncbi:carbohydrate ABC transporter permease [Actinocatenispora comari]|jgi:multiple sugar transport system permease protein|uniref:Putative sugar ABC transporter, permease protein n=1 Tax=Actinocatenispora comari TaxID=2807577 RepID=A0A8J4ER05_9ACTN|nr:carbohydrate ABC transporter permease [Actinocatenispora comari]GIL30369.1 putative sugar ABC transporter, permease protein [Actinocatenispora comari]
MKATARVAVYAVLVVGAFVSVFPYLMVVFTSLKTAPELNSTAPWLPAVPGTLDNFVSLFDGSIANVSFVAYLWHTVLLTVVLTVGQLVFTTFAAYAFARMRFPGRQLLFWAYVATLMVPNVVTMIPLYLIMRQIGWVDTWMGLVAPYVLGSPYGIFLMRQFFQTLPADLEDAARIDGAGTMSILLRVILPLSKPILGTLTILTVVFSWHNFLWPLIISSSDSTRVVTVGIASLQGNLGADYNLMMAGSFVALVPLIVVFLLFQRSIVRSVALTGLK